jgi:hypothetical protein
MIIQGTDLVVQKAEAPLAPATDPLDTLTHAKRAAEALQSIVSQKPDPVIVNGKQYLEFEDWQTLGHFYGVHVRTGDAEPVTINGVEGAKARAEVLNDNGLVIGGAAAACLRDEDQWGNKPWFQLASMAQTRAGAKALRNVLAWVAVLAGYRPTPAEEMRGISLHREQRTPPPIFQAGVLYTGLLKDYAPAVQAPLGQKGGKPQRVLVDVDGADLLIGGFALADSLTVKTISSWINRRVTVSYLPDKTGKYKNLKTLALADEAQESSDVEQVQDTNETAEPSDDPAESWRAKLRTAHNQSAINEVWRQISDDVKQDCYPTYTDCLKAKAKLK